VAEAFGDDQPISAHYIPGGSSEQGKFVEDYLQGSFE
jgi:hypothetical protein